MMARVARAALFALMGGLVLVWSGEATLRPGDLVSQAGAKVGRPATPVSYAGVARRTTRRAVAVDAGTTNCVTTCDAYGEANTVCN
jgi:hypothetical protein